MPNILCELKLSNRDATDVAALSVLLNKSTEEIVRMAVKKFSSLCVPTHNEKTKKK